MSDCRLALLVAPEGRCEGLRSRLRRIGVNLLRVHDCRQARLLLETSPSVDVVITAVTLPDGNWCEIHRYLMNSNPDTILVVSTSRADATLWSEVIWRGAYDLLVEPYQDDELERCVQGAIRVTDSRKERGASAAGG